MNALSALTELGKAIAKVPADVRPIVIDVVRAIADGDSHDIVIEKARRASLAAAAKRGYRRGPQI